MLCCEIKYIVKLNYQSQLLEIEGNTNQDLHPKICTIKKMRFFFAFKPPPDGTRVSPSKQRFCYHVHFFDHNIQISRALWADQKSYAPWCFKNFNHQWSMQIVKREKEPEDNLYDTQWTSENWKILPIDTNTSMTFLHKQYLKLYYFHR